MLFKRPGKAEREAAVQPDEEAELIARIQANPAEFALLYERYFARIYRYCLRRLGQPEEAEDVTSLIFTRALAGIHQYRGGSVAAWLFQIAHNAVVNQLRGRKPQLSLDAALGDEWAVAPGDELLEKLVQLEERELLARLIAELPSEQRELLALSVAGGLSAREIGQVLGKSEGAVWVALHRIVQRLKAAYRRQSQLEESREL